MKLWIKKILKSPYLNSWLLIIIFSILSIWIYFNEPSARQNIFTYLVFVLLVLSLAIIFSKIFDRVFARVFAKHRKKIVFTFFPLLVILLLIFDYQNFTNFFFNYINGRFVKTLIILFILSILASIILDIIKSIHLKKIRRLK